MLFLCIGFMIAVLYIDLVFDCSALPFRRKAEVLPPAVLDPITTYYRYITRNPYLLMLVMLTATGCIAAELLYGTAPHGAARVSLALMIANALVAVSKVIPTAQRLATGEGTPEQRTAMVHSLLPFHLGLLAAMLLLGGIQLFAVYNIG